MRNTQTAQALHLVKWEAWALSWQFLSLLEPTLVITTMRMTMVVGLSCQRDLQLTATGHALSSSP